MKKGKKRKGMDCCWKEGKVFLSLSLSELCEWIITQSS